MADIVFYVKIFLKSIQSCMRYTQANFRVHSLKRQTFSGGAQFLELLSAIASLLLAAT